jgi:myotubularin-related protein 5/13
MGILTNMQHEVNDVFDVIVADLDGGSLSIPTSLISPISNLPPVLLDSTSYSLTLILQPELSEADNAFSTNNHEINESRNQGLIDKEIRAVFMRIFAQLMQGYEISNLICRTQI